MSASWAVNSSGTGGVYFISISSAWDAESGTEQTFDYAG